MHFSSCCLACSLPYLQIAEQYAISNWASIILGLFEHIPPPIPIPIPMPIPMPPIPPMLLIGDWSLPGQTVIEFTPAANIVHMAVIELEAPGAIMDCMGKEELEQLL